MQRLPLIGGSYSARSVIANAQRCLNLFPEQNREDSPTPITMYQRPGLVPLTVPTSKGQGRGIWRASNGDGYCVIGSTFYFIGRDWTLRSLGSIAAGTTMCSMIDNGIQLILAIGAPYAGNAAGSISFAVNPVAGSTMTLNGVVWTFIAGASSGTNIHIEGSLGLTLLATYPILNASLNASMIVANYGIRAVGANIEITVQYKTPGAIGTLYTLAASVATPSAAHLNLSYFIGTTGYYANLGDISGGALAVISDTVWTGADRVDYLDTFVVWNVPGTNQFRSTPSNALFPMAALDVATKTGYPDPLMSIIVNRHEIFLPGELKSEVWYDAGTAAFPFAQVTGTYVEHGLVAKQSIAGSDICVFWLGSDLQGQGIVFRKKGYEVKRISNHALEYAIREMARTGIISDAVGYTYQIDGHVFYVLTFVTGNQTWVWDEAIGEPDLGWHQRTWTSDNGTSNRDRGITGCFLYGKNVCQDWETGIIYEQSMVTYSDTVWNGDQLQEYPIQYLRQFPHLMSGVGPDGKPMLADGKIVQHDRFAIDVECGNAPEGLDPKFTLRYSDDRGKTWDATVLMPAGKAGKYITRPDVRGLGQALDRVYELSWSFQGQVALNGAWVEGRVNNQ